MPDRRGERRQWWVFDLPLWKDPIAWLAGVACAVAISSTFRSYSVGGELELAGNEVALAIDTVIAIVAQTLIFGGVPGGIRAYLRRKRSADASSAVTSGSAVGPADRPPIAMSDMDNSDESPRSISSSRFRSPRFIACAAVLVAILALAEWLVRNGEMDALMDAVEESEEAMVQGRDDLWALVERRGSDGQFSDGERREIRFAAGDVAEAIESAGDGVRTVTILPWHRAALAARSKYMDHSDAWVDWMRDIERDETVLDESRSEIGSTFRIAERRFGDAEPWFAQYDISDRIDEVFAE